MVSFVIATAAMAGWALRSEALLRLLTVPPMVFNTALCFALAALALICDAATPPWRTLLQTVLGAAIAAIGTATAVEQMFALDLGISWKGLHEWFPDIRHETGGMSLAAGSGFVLVGIHFVAGGYVPARVVKYLLNAVSAAIISIGLFKLASNALGLEALFANQFFQLASPSTAVGFIVIGAGQWLAWRRRAPP